LSNWWRIAADELQTFRVDHAAVTKQMAPGGTPNHQQVEKLLNEFSRLNQTLEIATAGVRAGRVQMSIDRFDRWFLNFRRSQEWRWLIFDAALPCFGGVAAISLLLCLILRGQ
jgi:hypothetical protein